MGDWKRGIIYTGLAAIAGAAGYTIGKYKYIGRKVSLGLVGLSLVLYAPKGCEVVEKYLETKADVEKVRINSESRKDSLDAVIKSEEVKSKPTIDSDTIFHELSKNRQELEQQYKQMISSNEKKYQELLKKNDVQYNSVLSNIREQNDYLKKKLEELSIDKSTKGISSNILPLNSTTQRDNAVLSYYLVDADKSERVIALYGVYSDGSQVSFNITSRASFSRTRGPDNGLYILRDKGSRRGDLYPGFLEMNDPIGISGAGEKNEYMKDIQNGSYTNRTGIRIPNEVYSKISDLVSSKKTVVNVHD